MSNRKRNGEGSIYQLPNGKWRAAMTIGHNKRKTFTGDRFADVQKRLTEARRTLDRGMPSQDGKQTLRVFLNRWLADVVEPSVRPATLRSYEQIIRAVPRQGGRRRALARARIGIHLGDRNSG
ncbi:MAG: hypothetical protein M3R13_10420 [Armatimonadota bacterium]|nr:hypothetical protein [Armatimonadota bacterium]